MKTTILAALLLLASQSYAQNPRPTLEVRATDVLSITCDSTEAKHGQLYIDYWLADGDTSLRTSLLASKILTEDDRMTIRLLIMGQNYTAEQIFAVTTNRCQEIAKRYSAEIQNPSVESYVRFQIDQNFNVQSFFVYPMTDYMRARFKKQEISQEISSLWQRFLEKFK